MDPRACTGCLLGGAVGDSLGLPYEGLGARRAARIFPGAPEHHLLPGRGMLSDDTEHACLTARAIALANRDVDRFGRLLAGSLRWWLAGLPAGIGLATLRSLLKSCIGFPPHRSGVYSAGNGPAMRSAIIGVALGDEPPLMVQFVRRSTCITHTDPKAFHGALAVAVAAHFASRGTRIVPAAYLRELQGLLEGEGAQEFLALVERAAASAAAGQTVAHFATAIGSRAGVSGYMLHTVPCVLQAWFRHGGNFREGLADIIAAGGDTDTAGAIFGGIVGATTGEEGIPAAWVEGIADWPRGVPWIRSLGEALAAGRRPPGYFVPGIPLRNAFFMVVVLAHGFRRLAPPY